MRVALVAFALLLSLPVAAAEPAVEPHVDDEACQRDGLRAAVAADADGIMAAGAAEGHCVLVLARL